MILPHLLLATLKHGLRVPKNELNVRRERLRYDRANPASPRIAWNQPPYKRSLRTSGHRQREDAERFLDPLDE